MTIVCIECCTDMVEIRTDLYRCKCGFEIEQLTIERMDELGFCNQKDTKSLKAC